MLIKQESGLQKLSGATSSKPPPASSTARRVYAAARLRALQHERRMQLPDAVRATNHTPRFKPLKPCAPLPFTSLGLSEPIQEGLGQMGLKTASPIQATAVPYARLGGDLLAQASSGEGKTLTYTLVALEAVLSCSSLANLAVVVVVPARELAVQVAGVIRRLADPVCVTVATVMGGTPESADEEKLRRPPCIVVGTPGRLEVVVRRAWLDVSHLKLLVLDEVDRLLDGSFDDSVEHICNMLPAHQTLAFSATVGSALRRELLAVMKQPAWIPAQNVVHNAVRQLAHKCTQEWVSERRCDEKIEALNRLLIQNTFNLCVVFMNDKSVARRVVNHLVKLSFTAKMINADIHQHQREAVVNSVHKGRVQVLVTTDVLSRGIDFDMCDLVVQMDVPRSTETYLHRVGRAGRFGKKGASVLLYNDDEAEAVTALGNDLRHAISCLEDDQVLSYKCPKHVDGISSDKSKNMQAKIFSLDAVEERAERRERPGAHQTDQIGSPSTLPPEGREVPTRGAQNGDRGEKSTASDPSSGAEAKGGSKGVGDEAAVKEARRPERSSQEGARKEGAPRQAAQQNAVGRESHGKRVASQKLPPKQSATEPNDEANGIEPHEDATVTGTVAPSPRDGWDRESEHEMMREKRPSLIGLMRDAEAPVKKRQRIRRCVTAGERASSYGLATSSAPVADKEMRKESEMATLADRRDVDSAARDSDMTNEEAEGAGREDTVNNSAMRPVSEEPGTGKEAMNRRQEKPKAMPTPVAPSQSGEQGGAVDDDYWDEYARGAYMQGYNEAYAQGLRMAHRLRHRLDTKPD